MAAAVTVAVAVTVTVAVVVLCTLRAGAGVGEQGREEGAVDAAQGGGAGVAHVQHETIIKISGSEVLDLFGNLCRREIIVGDCQRNKFF